MPLLHGVTFGEAFRVWSRVAALSFGGPAGQIAVMHRILVEEKRWIGENRFLQREALGSDATVCAVVAREPNAQNWRRGSNAFMRVDQRGQATELIELLHTSL